MKVPCGGFDLDESVFNVDKNSKQVKLNSPISYDYMPEGYPKKDGWSIEWDGNTEGKVTVALGEMQLCKISDMVLSEDDLFGATVIIHDPTEMTGTITSDNVDSYQDSDDVIEITLMFERPELLSFTCVKKDNAYAGGITFPEKGLYINGDEPRFIIDKENITPMSADFLPKNLNVVFTSKSGTNTPTNCNVTYDELRGWVERGVPVFPVFIYTANSQYVIHNITEIALFTDKLGFVYYDGAVGSRAFAYKSDGTIEILSN